MSSGQGAFPHRRTKEEAERARAERRSEIERRALLLEPPLQPDALALISSFQAAILVTAPMDDRAWEALKPRLISQRHAAEKRHRESLASTSFPAKPKEPPERTLAKAEKGPTGAEWDEAQAPLRARLSNFADEIMRQSWDHGYGVNKKNVQQFAAEALLYVRERFYGEVAKEASEAVAAGVEPAVDPPRGPWTHKLSIENMRWLYRAKLKTHIEHHRKDVFICNGCTGPIKYYTLESVLQHYAAKHTRELSRGNVVVHWRSEWPETSPFHPKPQARIAQQNERRVKSVKITSSAPPQPTHDQASQACMAPITFTRSDPSMLDQHVVSYQPPSPRPSHVLSGKVPRPARPADDSSVSYANELNFLAQVAQGTWNKICELKGLLDSVKACVVIHHIAKRIQKEYSKPAKLEMFIDALTDHKLMRPICKMRQLQCKMCAKSVREPGGGHYSLPQLARHFKGEHVDKAYQMGPGPSDWRIDMIMVPGISLLADLSKLCWTASAYTLVSDALPWAFRGSIHIMSTDEMPAIATGQHHAQDELTLQEIATADHGRCDSWSHVSSKAGPELRYQQPTVTFYNGQFDTPRQQPAPQLGSEVPRYHASTCRRRSPGSPGAVAFSGATHHPNIPHFHAVGTEIHSGRHLGPQPHLSRSAHPEGRSGQTYDYAHADPYMSATSAFSDRGAYEWGSRSAVAPRILSTSPKMGPAEAKCVLGNDPGPCSDNLQNGDGHTAKTFIGGHGSAIQRIHDYQLVQSARGHSRSPQPWDPDSQRVFQCRERSLPRDREVHYPYANEGGLWVPSRGKLVFRSAPFTEGFEVAELRETAGSYCVPRPVRREPIDTHPYGRQTAVRQMEPQARHMTIGEGAPVRPVVYEPLYSKPGVQEYDPRYPAAAKTHGRSAAPQH